MVERHGPRPHALHVYIATLTSADVEALRDSNWSRPDHAIHLAIIIIIVINTLCGTRSEWAPVRGCALMDGRAGKRTS